MPGGEYLSLEHFKNPVALGQIQDPNMMVAGPSKYDSGFVIPDYDPSNPYYQYEVLNKLKAENQGFLMELGTAAANLIPNTALSIVETAAQLADIEDWSNMIQGNAANYGNTITEWANRNKNVFGDVYQKTPGENNIFDSAWWVSNGAGLVESVAAFGLTGYGVGSILGKGASSLSKALNAYGKAKMGIELSAQLGTSGVLAFTEGAMTGAQVFKDVYPEAYNNKLQEIIQQGAQQYGEDNLTEEYYKYADTAAKQFAEQIAGESATKAVRINTGINTFLNLPETGALFRSMSANRYLDDALRRTRGEKFDDYVARIKSFDTTKHITREGIKTKVKQIGGEALEEMVNVYAEQEGKNVSRKAMDKDIVSLGEMLADDDIWAAGFWGAIGGSMQSFVMNKMPKWVTQEDGTTKRTTIGEYNKQQVTNKYEEQLGDLKDRLTEFVTAKDNLVKASQTNDEKLYNESINTIFKYNSFNSIVKGVEEQLIDDYSRIMTLSPEEAAQQGFKGDYKQDAANKIQSIRENTTEWNRIQDRYMSQDLDLAGYPETIFQQFINVENNKKIIAEQEFEINKLQSDINQSYALKGTDLTIAAYNDIVSSIRALDNDFELETIDLENLLNLQSFDKNTQNRIIAKLNNKYGNLENAKTQIEKNLDNIREKANDLARTFKLQRENFDIQVDPENKLSQEEKDRMFAQILSENEFEIDALTEAKSQLQRNRETLRAQEEELRNLKSKDGVNKFKELKRQKLTEQNERVEQEVVEEQEQQAEAERQAQQEVVDDIRRRQEEEPETVTEEEVITLQQLEELEEQEGETYQEGEYTGEGSTPKELDKQYEDISDSANKSDEDGKIEDQQGNLIFIDDKLIYSFDKIAYASTVEYSEDKTTGVIKHTSLELNPETNPDLLTTKFVAGTPIKIKKLEAAEFKPFTAPREITFKDELGREVLVANKGELVTFEMLSHPYMQPIGIYDDSNNLIGMLHDVTYVRPERVLQQSLEEDRNNLIALRSKIGNDFIETTIVGKTNGHINQFRDGFRKLSELMPGPIEFAIATSSIQLNTSKTTIVDDLINKPKYKVGQVYAITYTPNGQKIAIPVKTTQVKEHPEVLNELLAAFDAFAEGKISQNQLKEVFSKYIYSTPTSEKLDAAGKNFKREADSKDRMYIDYDSLNVDGIVFGKSGDTKRFLSSRTPKEDIEKLRKIFISILSESYININFEKVKNESFVKNFTTSNVRFYKLPDGRVTVFDNPVISISTSFAPGIKPIEKTEEQPRVEPTPQVQTIEEIKNSIAQLRAQEQAEYAAMSDPNDTVEKEKIYNKYDELITPLLNQAEADIEARREEEYKGNIVEEVKAYRITVKGKEYEIYEEKYDKNSDEYFLFVKRPNGEITSVSREEEKIITTEGTNKQFLRDETSEWIDLEEKAKIDAELDAELDAVKKVKPATTVQAAPVSTDAKTKVEKAQRQLDNVESGLNPNAKHPLFNVGQKYDVGYTVEVRDFKDERTDTTKDGVEVITKIYKPAIVDENGTMVSRAEVEVTIFDSYEQAEEFINAQYNKYKAIAEEKLAKAKTELAALESKPTDAKAELQKKLDEEIKDQKERLKKLTIGTPIGGKYNLKVGDRYDADVIDASVDPIDQQQDPNFDPDIAENDGAGYSVISKVYEYGEIKDGKTSKKATIQIYTFNTKAEADAFLEQKKFKDEKNKAKLGSNPVIDKLKEELATLEGKSKIDTIADIERKRQEKYNTQYNNLVSGNVLDNEGNPVYEEDKGIGANGLSTLTEKTYGHGHIRTSGLNSLKVLEDLLEGGEFSGMFGQIGQGAYSTWESGKFIIVSNNINPTKNNKLNLNEVEIILNAGLSPFAQELANKYPNVIFKDFNGKKYNAELAAVEQPTIQPEETKTTFTSNNGLEFDIDFEDDADLLPMFTEVKSGVQELFDFNPELASIGTLKQYSQYLDSIFPNSKVKDIVYHGSSYGFEGDNFDTSIITNGRTQGDGVYFSTDRKAVERLADISESMYEMFTAKEMQKYLKIAVVNAEKLIDGNEVVVQPEQIHILGSSKDIEGFKQFVQSGKQIEKSLSLQDKVNNLIQEGKITKFCK